MIALGAFLDTGFDAVNPDRIGHIASDTRDRCYVTGDVRYCIAAECLEIIASCWGDDGAVRRSFFNQLQEFVTGEFAQAIREPDAEISRSLMLSARSTLIGIVHEAGDLIYD